MAAPQQQSNPFNENPTITFEEYVAVQASVGRQVTPVDYVVDYLQSTHAEILTGFRSVVGGDPSRLLNKLATASFTRSTSDLTQSFVQAAEQSSSAVQQVARGIAGEFIDATCAVALRQEQTADTHAVTKPTIVLDERVYEAIKKSLNSLIENEFRAKKEALSVENVSEYLENQVGQIEKDLNDLVITDENQIRNVRALGVDPIDISHMKEFEKVDLIKKLDRGLAVRYEKASFMVHDRASDPDLPPLSPAELQEAQLNFDVVSQEVDALLSKIAEPQSREHYLQGLISAKESKQASLVVRKTELTGFQQQLQSGELEPAAMVRHLQDDLDLQMRAKQQQVVASCVRKYPSIILTVAKQAVQDGLQQNERYRDSLILIESEVGVPLDRMSKEGNLRDYEDPARLITLGIQRGIIPYKTISGSSGFVSDGGTKEWKIDVGTAIRFFNKFNLSPPELSSNKLAEGLYERLPKEGTAISAEARSYFMHGLRDLMSQVYEINGTEIKFKQSIADALRAEIVREMGGPDVADPKVVDRKVDEITEFSVQSALNEYIASFSKALFQKVEGQPQEVMRITGLLDQLKQAVPSPEKNKSRLEELSDSLDKAIKELKDEQKALEERYEDPHFGEKMRGISEYGHQLQQVREKINKVLEGHVCTRKDVNTSIQVIHKAGDNLLKSTNISPIKKLFAEVVNRVTTKLFNKETFVDTRRNAKLQSIDTSLKQAASPGSKPSTPHM